MVGARVEIAAGTRLMANVYLEGPAWIGEDNLFYPYSTVGVAPQDLKYKGEVSETRIGRRNKIREFVTIHRGTEGGGMVTRIGDDNLLMAYVHVAHDVQVGNGVVLQCGYAGGPRDCRRFRLDRRFLRSAPVLPHWQERHRGRL